MSNKVLNFLNESGGSNFTETAPRPPVYGEENDIASNTSNGGGSTRSSGSHNSQLSNKSQGSNNNHSPAVTPRRSNKDKSMMSISSCSMDEDDIAPLGFEPEGSVSSSPPFTENSTPSFMKWAENLNYLLDDLQGVDLFKKFLEQECIGTYTVDFWFACQGLKKKEPCENITNVIRVIHKKFVKSDKLPCVQEETKRTINEKVQKRQGLESGIFDVAQAEVEREMRINTYPLFIKSDLYVQYVQKGGESPKSSNASSGSITRPVSVGPLPTLVEDQELQTNVSMSTSVCGPPPSKSLVSRTSLGEVQSGAKKSTDAFTSFPVPYTPRTPVPHPYHVSYAPVSTQDSEIQSLSSDALTDDTRSLTDSSVSDFNEKAWKRQTRRAMRKRAEQNRENGYHQFIPRTQRAPKDSNFAEVDPKRFAQMLIEKLEKVIRDREKEEKIRENMDRMFTVADVDEADKSINHSLDRSINRSIDRSIDRSMERSIVSSLARHNSSSTSMPLMTSTVIDEDDNPNSILEEHMSRIWETSAQQTPSRSPGGRHSPTLKANKDRLLISKNNTIPLPLPAALHSKSIHKKRPDYHSSFDSGMGEDKPAIETHRHIHHHHHHHHSRDKTSKIYDIEVQQHINCWSAADQTNVRAQNSESDRGRTTRKANRKHSDASSNIDSGISMIESIPPHDPSTEKVLSWIMDNSRDNEGQGNGATGSTDTERSSHKRFRSNMAATSSANPVPHSKGSTKKSGHGSSRSTSAERTGHMQASLQPWMSMSAGAALPSQPFAQDPSMPLPTPPNTTVQLEEAKRRLEDASRSTPVKSKSFTGVPSKEKKANITSSSQVYSRLPTTRTVPSDLDLSVEAPSNPTEKKSSKKSSSSSANTSGGSAPPTGATAQGDIVIGYFFCGEPIPYRHTVNATKLTLSEFKHLIGRRGNFKFFFKKKSNEFESGSVFEEIQDDTELLPLWDGKIVAKVERTD